MYQANGVQCIQTGSSIPPTRGEPADDATPGRLLNPVATAPLATGFFFCTYFLGLASKPFCG